jgi:hypothetical protein
MRAPLTSPFPLLHFFLLLLLLSPRGAAGGSAAPAPIALGLGVHTLLEGSLIAAGGSCALAPGAVHKDPRPAVVREHPWEATLGFYSAAAFVPARLSASGAPRWHWYYTCAWDDLFTTAPSLCVAVSEDAGATWSKPLLPYYPWTGANGTAPPAPTNIVFRTQNNSFSGSVLVDAAAPPGEAFLLAFEASLPGAPARLPFAARSADGLRFEAWAAAVARGPLLGVPQFADTSLALASAPGALFMAGRLDGAAGGSATARGMLYCANSSGPHRAPLGTAQRCAAGAPRCNATGGGWPPPTQLLALGAPDDDQCLDVYNFPAVSVGPDAAFGGAPSWVALPAMIRHLPQAQSGAPTARASGNDGFMDARLAVSRDAAGAAWVLPHRAAFLPRGVGVRDAASGLFNGSGSDLDAGFVFVANGGVLDPDDARGAAAAAAQPSPWLSILYWGGQTTHAGGGAFWYLAQGAFTGLLRARVRREGWVALSAPRTDTGAGWAATVPLRLPAAAGTLVMRLNAEVDAAGNLTLQLQDAGTMAPLAGYTHADCMPLRGNSVRQDVAWGGDRGTWLGGSAALPAGASVVLNFSLTHARVFAWELSLLP